MPQPANVNKSESVYRILAKAALAFLVFLLLVVVTVMGTALLQVYREYQAFQSNEAALAQELKERNAELHQRQEYLRLVLEDPQFLERVVRDKLGFARANETIYRFED